MFRFADDDDADDDDGDDDNDDVDGDGDGDDNELGRRLSCLQVMYKNAAIYWREEDAVLFLVGRFNEH